MTENIERLGTSEIKIQVRIPWTELEKSYRSSLSKVRGTVQVRGFRKGKVPMQMIEKMFGGEVIREVAVDEVARRVQEMVREKKIVPLSLPLEIESKVEAAKGAETVYEDRVEVLPMIDRISFEGLELEPKREIGDADVEERIRILAARKAPLETAPEEHEIGEWDQVVLEGSARFAEDEEPKKIEDMRADLAPWTQPPPNLVEHMQGKKVGDEGDVNLILPRDEGGQNQQMAALTYKVKEIVTRRVPEIDEELARDFDMESLEQLEAEVREALEKEALEEHVEKNGALLIEQLLDRVEFDLPPSQTGFIAPPEPPEDDESEDEKKAREEREKIAGFYERFARRNLLTTILAYQNELSLPEEAMQHASEHMKAAIDRGDGSRREKKEAFEQWRKEYEQNVFNHVLSSFLVQEVEKLSSAAGEGDEESAERESADGETGDEDGEEAVGEEQ